MKAILDHKESIAKNITTFWFKPEKPVRQIAGQFTEITLKHNNPDKRGDRRWFTLSNSPEDKLLSITTKLAEKPSSFKKKLFSLKPGVEVNLADPMGDFVLPKNKETPMLFVAGGIGCTPFHSIVKYLADTEQKRNIHLIYAANHIEEVAFKDLFETLDKFEIILSDPPKDWGGQAGHIDAKTILNASDNGQRHIFLSGPEPMVEILDEQLLKLGISRNKLNTDYFPGYQPI